MRQAMRMGSGGAQTTTGMGYSGGGDVVLLNIAAYLGRLRIRVFCMSRWRGRPSLTRMYCPNFFAALRRVG